jgi:hypothetical protein
LGEILGFTIPDPSAIQEIKGIGELGVPFALKNLSIRFNDRVVSARVAWSLIEEVPPLLGRLDIFSLFDITFHKEVKTIFNYYLSRKTPQHPAFWQDFGVASSSETI